VLLTNSGRLAAAIDEHASHWVSHHHPADVAALAIAVAELAADAPAYASRTVCNARHLAAALDRHGIPVCAAGLGYTRSHQVWLDVAPLLDPFEASRLLLEAGIVVNAIDIPYLPSRTGLRLGVQEATRLGMDAGDMDQVASILARILTRKACPGDAAPEVRELLARHAEPGAGMIDAAIRILAMPAAEERP
jgi:glycine hydroxymethyltransferase